MSNLESKEYKTFDHFAGVSKIVQAGSAPKKIIDYRN